MKVTYTFRVKDKHADALNKMARAVNFVWNFCEETQRHALKWSKRWPSGYDLQKLTSGSSKELCASADTINEVCVRYDRSRRQSKKNSLKWRGRRSLGWVPFKTGTVRHTEGHFVFFGTRYEVWLSRPMPPAVKLSSGNFSQDARGRWYINIPVDIDVMPSIGKSAVGIDLGLKTFATISDGEKVESRSFYRDMQAPLGIAQRAANKDRVKAISAKIANRRKDHLHKLSTRLVKQNGAIFVGNVNSAGLAKTNMAKSVLDAGWSQFRTYLAYKAIRHGIVFEEVDEAFSTQACSSCGVVSASSPKGRADLGIREWTCMECGERHDRDVNAARNILARGHARLAGGSRCKTDVNSEDRET